MNVDWLALQKRFPRAFAMMVLAKRLRTKVGLAVALGCVIEGFSDWERPFELERLNGWVAVGLVLVLAGLVLRIAALGVLKKKEALATAGVYSLCRHPLYLGSILMTYGFCCLLNDAANFLWATAYFLVFYSLTIVWEEVRLAERFGGEHRRFVHRTPLLVPLGRLRPTPLRLGVAMTNGGAVLVSVTILLLISVEVMAKTMH